MGMRGQRFERNYEKKLEIDVGKGRSCALGENSNQRFHVSCDFAQNLSRYFGGEEGLLENVNLRVCERLKYLRSNEDV